MEEGRKEKGEKCIFRGYLISIRIAQDGVVKRYATPNDHVFNITLRNYSIILNELFQNFYVNIQANILSPKLCMVKCGIIEDFLFP